MGQRDQFVADEVNLHVSRSRGRKSAPLPLPRGGHVHHATNLVKAVSAASAGHEPVSGPVLAGNDVKLGALAEHWRGTAADVQVVYILAGHLVSVGILIDGQVRQGRHGAAGEIGYLKAARWYEVRDALAAGKPIDAPEFIDDLATGIAAAVLVVDPDKVIIGGGLSQAGAYAAPARSEVVASPRAQRPRRARGLPARQPAHHADHDGRHGFLPQTTSSSGKCGPTDSA